MCIQSKYIYFKITAIFISLYSLQTLTSPLRFCSKGLFELNSGHLILTIVKLNNEIKKNLNHALRNPDLDPPPPYIMHSNVLLHPHRVCYRNNV